MYEIIILKEGYSSTDGPGTSQMKACGTATLVKGPHNIIVDTGNPWDRELILERLHQNEISPEQVSYVVCSNGHVDKVGNLNLFPKAAHIVGYDLCVEKQFFLHEFNQVHRGLTQSNVSPDQIEFVVCTHGHSDHVGNLNLFPNAIIIVSQDICHGDQYLLHGFDQGIPYEIDDDVEVIPTPGHTGADVSVVVRNTSYGTVILAGDVFECEEDLENPHLWQQSSENPEIQQQSRLRVLKKADYIVPGHGPMFKVPDSYKAQLSSVLMYEEFSQSDGSSYTEALSYQVFEVD